MAKTYKLVRMQSTASCDFYVARLPGKGEQKKLRRRRYDRFTRRHEWFEQAKMPKSSK